MSASPSPSAPATPRRGVALVTGGSAGVGRAVVRELAARGWDIGVVARGPGRLEAAVREVRETGRLAVAAPADVPTPRPWPAPPTRWRPRSDRSTCGSTARSRARSRGSGT